MILYQCQNYNNRYQRNSWKFNLLTVDHGFKIPEDITSSTYSQDIGILLLKDNYIWN